MKKLNLLLTSFIILGVHSLFAQTYTISTVAGTGTRGYNGDNLPATSADLNRPVGIALDSIGNLIIADTQNNRIRKVDDMGNISTIAGNGTGGYNGDNIFAITAQLNEPIGITFDKLGNLYIVDKDENRIRKVDHAGIITTIAGTGTFGYSGDNGAATIAELDGPYDVKINNSGNVLIADRLNSRIRKIDNGGIITTIVGNGVHGYSGDGGPAIAAEIGSPRGIAVDNLGNIYMVDWFNSTIRKINSAGTITTIAGDETDGYAGDGGLATAATLDGPSGIAVDAWGNIYFSDKNNHVIRKIDNSGIITTIAGIGTSGFSGDNGPAISAELYRPGKLTIDPLGNIYFADERNNRVRKLTPSNLGTTPQHKASFKVYPNPVNHELTLESDGNIETIEIYDAVGRLMQNTQPLSGVVKIDLSSYTNGTYFITMKTKSGEVFREKIIKQ